jgi:hypothetical protein
MPTLRQLDRPRFIAANPGPWTCHLCGEPITEVGGNKSGRALHVHHLDPDVAGVMGNLVPIHKRCHIELHRCQPGCTCRKHLDHSAKRVYKVGWQHTDETRRKISMTKRAA